MKRPIDYLFSVSREDAFSVVLFVVVMFWNWFLVARIIEACGGAW
jgi:hypothetical protein